MLPGRSSPGAVPGLDVHAQTGGSDEQAVAPGPAQDLDQLEPIDRRIGVRPDRDRAVTLEQRHVRARLADPRTATRATRAASSSLPISPNGTNGRRGMSRAVSGRALGSGISPPRVSAIEAGRWAWATAPMSGRAAYTARWIARSDDGPRPDADRASRAPGPIVTTTMSSSRQLVLAPPARRDRHPVRVKPDGQVALAGGDQAARPETTPGGDDPGGGDARVHASMVVEAAGHPPLVPSAGARAPTPPSQPRLQGPADVAGHLRRRRCGHVHGAAAARPGTHRARA